MKNIEMKQRMIQYLMKSSKHLFKTENGRFFKVLLTKVDSDIWVYTTVEWDDDYFNIKVVEVKVTDLENSLALMKYDIFPQWRKGTKSVRYFKDARRKMFEIIKLVRREYDGTTSSVEGMRDEAMGIISEIPKVA